MAASILAITFVAVLVLGVPWLSYLTARHSELRQLPRPALYLSAVISQWLLALLGAGVVWATGVGLRDLGFRPLPFPSVFQWVLLMTIVTAAVLGLMLLLEGGGWWPQESELVYLLMPVTREEKLWAVLLVAPTAALCEEFLYRGYLLAQVSQWTQSPPLALGLSSLAFGLAHVYQGWSGMIRAALLGILLAYPVVRLGSLYPSMAAHFVIDVLALVWLGPKFLPRPPTGKTPPGSQ